MNKLCPRCKESKPRVAFPPNKARRGGIGSSCRECKNKRNRERWANDLARKRSGLLAGRKYREANRERLRVKALLAWTPEKAARQKAARDPFKERARNILRDAVHKGKIKKPKKCQGCGWTGTLHGHHEDYNAPLVVRWLCSICHGRAHRQ
jgi:hypothetical protein